MVREDLTTAIRYEGGSPSSRRADLRVILHQQLPMSAFWTLPLYFIRGETEAWTRQHILTPQVEALVPRGAETVVWPARGQALASIAAGTTVVWSTMAKLPWLKPVTTIVSKLVARVLAKYVGSLTMGAALSTTGIGAAAGALLDAGMLAWAVSDLWNAKSDLIEAILDEWFPE